MTLSPTCPRRRVYLDANASHPLLPRVRERLARAVLNEDDALANPSSVHGPGQAAKKSLAELKGLLSQFLGRSDADELIISSGATEAINTAMRGFFQNRLSLGRRPVLFASAVEHSAVLDTARALDPQFVTLPVCPGGRLDGPAALALIEARLADPETDALLCLQAVNNETGGALGLEEFYPPLQMKFGARFSRGALRSKKSVGLLEQEGRVFLLLDAAQALGKMEDSGLRRLVHLSDYVAVSGHKLGAPSGIGALWVRPGSPFAPLLTGGSQERKRRAGSHNTLGILGWTEALADWRTQGEVYRERLARQRDFLRERLGRIEGLHFNGATELCNTLNFHVKGCPEESLVLALDLAGYSLSSGSACNSGAIRPSHVLTALGLDEETAKASLRVCLTVETSDEDVQGFVKVLETKIHFIRDSRKRAQEFLAEIG